MTLPSVEARRLLMDTRKMLSSSTDNFLGLCLKRTGTDPRDSNWRSFLTSYRGDTIQVTLHNQITGPQEGVALHWHGMLQKGTPSVLVRPGNHFLPTNFRNRWMDGVPAISQCPIPYGQSFTYSFTADLYGTSWYHSHYSAQYSGGLLGPMIIHGPSTLPYDIGM